ncbi:MAG: serine hydrolase [Bacteroidales bacterium]|nr:serine hydrolase [Clostridium sp.]MCM1204915.1 serine hydrolase [Bacteroidales bacterium]
MKCLNDKKKKVLIFILATALTASLLTGCGSFDAYDMEEPLHISSTVNLPIVRPSGLADENVVIPYDAYVFDDSDYEYEAGLLINQTQNSVIRAVNPHKRIYPASMTKILTAIVVMDAVDNGQISLNDTVVIRKEIEFNEDNVTALGLEPGDYITVNELLYGLLVSSYNDCAIALARYVAGSVKDFVALMNDKAALLGATNSHFVNPHGLHDNNHYTTPYDLYLIFKEFLKRDTLVKIDSNSTYLLTLYRDSEKLQFEITATNAYLSNSVEMPTGYHITGWKTGTTEKAGCCIILEFVNDESNEEYICLVSNAADHEMLYQNVGDMLKEIY